MQESESSQEEFLIGTITKNKDDPRKWFVELPVNGHSMKFKIDSGADVSVMSLSTYENMPEVPCSFATNNAQTQRGQRSIEVQGNILILHQVPREIIQV